METKDKIIRKKSKNIKEKIKYHKIILKLNRKGVFKNGK